MLKRGKWTIFRISMALMLRPWLACLKEDFQDNSLLLENLKAMVLMIVALVLICRSDQPKTLS